ncbi:MAG: hypothetical protein ACRD0J_00450 [Acidimicrobiales bacterium]
MRTTGPAVDAHPADRGSPDGSGAPAIGNGPADRGAPAGAGARRTRGEDGQIGGVEAVIFGVLVFVLGTLVIANAWGVIDAKLAVSSAAREAARAFVQAPSAGQAPAAAQAAAAQAMADSGRDPAQMTLTMAGSLTRCTRVTATVRYPVPLVRVPLIGELGRGFTAVAHHSELVDPYRNALPGQARCPA